MGGKIPGSTASFVVGGDFAGVLFEGTAHGELAWFNPVYRTPYWKTGVEYDYNFVSGSALVVEFYHAGNGATDPRRYDFAALRAGLEPSLAWNAVPDLWLTVAWRRFGGDKISEYGRQPNQTVLTAQYWF